MHIKLMKARSLINIPKKSIVGEKPRRSEKLCQ